MYLSSPIHAARIRAYTPARQNSHTANRRRRNLDQDAAKTGGRLPEGFFAKKSIARPIVRIS
jgi:hypothetical protein